MVVEETELVAPDRFQPVKSADRTLEILERLAAAPDRCSLGELARDLKIPKSSLHGILRTMAQRGWVETDSSGLRFGLGVRALLVGAAYVDADDAVGRVQSSLDWLSQSFGEAVHLGRLDGADVVYLAKRESPHPLRLFSAIGRRLPAHATALGKSLLAERSNREVDQILSWPLRSLTHATITSPDGLHAELDSIRERGYAVDHEENAEGIRCFAVALRTDNPPQDAISFSVPVFRLSEEREQEAVSMLRQARDRVEARARLRSSM